MKRTGEAVWRGRLRDGEGTLTTASRTVADARYSFPTRFGDAVGTNPEELLAAAHAGCFAMALAFLLESAGLPPERIETRAELTVENRGARWSVAGVHLHVRARVPGAGESDFQRIAEQARTDCLVSRLFNTSIAMSALLERETV